jgi:hypothetical protein
MRILALTQTFSIQNEGAPPEGCIRQYNKKKAKLRGGPNPDRRLAIWEIQTLPTVRHQALVNAEGVIRRRTLRFTNIDNGCLTDGPFAVGVRACPASL